MYVLVRQPFEHAGHYHERGDVLRVMAELEAVLADLLCRGVVIVIHKDSPPPQLTTPEDGLQTVLR